MAKPKHGKYKVLNPRGVPEGMPVITMDSHDGPVLFYEGDTFEGIPGDYVERGFLKEVK
jgi:hypothetical protein